MKRIKRENTVRCLLAVLTSLGLSARASAGGMAEGKSITAQGETKSVYVFSTGATSGTPTPDYALVDLGAGVVPLQFTDHGEVVLVPEGMFQYPEHRQTALAYRWLAGERTPLGDPDNSLHFTGIPLANHRGLVAATASTSGLEDNGNTKAAYSWTLVWLPGQSQPVRLASPAYSCITFDFPLKESLANVVAINDENRLWGFFATGVGHYAPPDQKYGFILKQFARWDSPTGTPSAPASDFDVSSLRGVNGRGNLIGSFVDDFGEGDFVDHTPVDFFPMAINQDGLVLGEEAPGSFLLWKEGQRYAVPSGQVSGIDDHNNLYGWTSDGRHVMWTTNPETRVSDPEKGGYQPIDYKPVTMPRGWSSTHEVIPGDGTIQLGLADYRDPDALSSPVERHAFMLVPAALRVDANRDGRIDSRRLPDNPDNQLAQLELPYFFWINDDDDHGELDGSDIPGASPAAANAFDRQVNGVRDLVDFFPVYLDVARLLEILPPSSGCVYKLSQADGAVGFVPTTLTPDTAGAYLTDPTVAAGLASAEVIPVTAGGVELSRQFLDGIGEQGRGIILVEGSAKTSHPLVLEVWQAGVRLAALTLPLSIDGVEAMYGHVNLRPGDNVMPAVPGWPIARNYPDTLTNGKNFAFVHGYNVTEQEARGWSAEMFKRLFWAGSRAKFWAVTWHGDETRTGGVTPNYHANVVNALHTAPAFAQFVAGLSGGVTVAAHSLGNMVVSSAIRDWGAPVDNYFLVNAAVAAEAYDGSLPLDPAMAHTDWTRASGGEYPRRFWASEWHSLFPLTDARSGLTWRDRFAGQHQAVYYNFYSSGEEVLAQDDDYTPGVLGVILTEAWRFLFGATNGERLWVYQEKLKGRTISGAIIGSNYGGWGFSPVRVVEEGLHGPHAPPPVKRLLTPSEAIALSARLNDTDLQARPFFDPGAGKGIGGESLAALYTDAGSDYARRHGDILLARMIPATSSAAGRVAVEAFGAEITNNFDMNAKFQTGWPMVRTQKNDRRWYHSDIRGAAYVYTHTLFEKWVELGGLNQ